MSKTSISFITIASVAAATLITFGQAQALGLTWQVREKLIGSYCSVGVGKRTPIHGEVGISHISRSVNRILKRGSSRHGSVDFLLGCFSDQGIYCLLKGRMGIH